MLSVRAVRRDQPKNFNGRILAQSGWLCQENWSLLMGQPLAVGVLKPPIYFLGNSGTAASNSCV